MDIGKIINEYKKMEGDKSTYLSLWQEIADFIYPQAYHMTRYLAKGQKRRRPIYDGTGERALDIFASSMLGILANPATKFIGYQSADPALMDNRDVQIHYEAVQKAAMAVFNNPRTKFFDNLFTALKTVGAFGTAPFIIEADKENVALFKSESPKSFDFTEDFAGNVKDIFLEKEFTVEQLKAKEGWELPQEVTTSDDKRKYKVLRYIQRNPDYNPEKAGEKFAMYISYHILRDTADVLNKEFFYTLPIAVARWDRLDLEKWADSPGRVALADIKLLNAYKRSEMSAIEKTLNPALQVSSESKFGKLDTSAGAVNVYRGGGEGLKPINSVGNITLPNQWSEGIKQDILSAFYVDVFQTADTPNITATEAQIRYQEKLRGISPKAAKLQSDLIGPIAERLYSLIVSREEMKEVKGEEFNEELVRPDPLRGKETMVTYLSPISQAQRSNERMQILQLVQDLGGLAQVKPELLDNIDFDAAAKEMVDISGVSEKLIVPEEDVEALREQRAQMAQQQQALSTLQQAGQTAKVLNEAGQAETTA